MKYAITLLRLLFLILFLFLIANGNMMLWFGLFAVSLAVALIFGRVYCGYACPMNTIMVPVEWLSKKLKFQRETPPKWLRSGKFAWVALAISIIAMLLFKKIWHVNLPILLIWLVISVLITLRYKPAVFHNLICPFGVLQQFFGRFARFTKKVNDKNCIGCKLCEKVCPSNAIVVTKEDKKAVINIPLCLQCNNCQQVCPKDAIHYMKKV